MAKIRRLLLWATLGLILALTLFSIYGAFIGADRAKIFFNTIPLALYWFSLFASLLLGILLFKRLLRVPALLFIHLGCIAILIGGLWGSAAGRELQNKSLKRNIIPDARMALVNGQQDNRVYLAHDTNEVRELPFTIALDEFRIEHYPGKLHIQDSNTKKTWALPVEPNAVYNLGPPHGSLTIAGVFENFKINIEEDPNGGRSVTAYDDPGPGSNPALEVSLENVEKPHYVFEGRLGHTQPGESLVMQYRKGMISDYISELKVLKDGKVVAQKDIEVNRPLYYGGYHFYQSSYGQDRQTGQMYTVLSVVPYTGLYWVYAGYILMCIGVAWQCWFLSISRVLKQEASHGN